MQYYLTFLNTYTTLSKNSNNSETLRWLLRQLNPDTESITGDKYEERSSINEQTLIELIRKHKVASHLYRIKDLANANTPPKIKQFLQATAQRNQLQKLAHAQEVITIHQLLQNHQIAHVFLKGIGLSLRIYGDPAYRHSGDIDLLVAPEQARKAQKLLLSAGYKPAHPETALSDKQFRKNIHLSHHVTLVKRQGGRAFALEVHWYLTNPHQALPLPTSEVLQGKIELTLGNTRLPVPGKIHSLVFNAYHGSVHQWFKLFWLKDFGTLIHQLTPKEVEAGLQLAKKLQIERSYILAFALCNRLWGTPMFDLTETRKTQWLLNACLNALETNEWKQQGIRGKLRSLGYRLKLKPGWHYKLALIWRLRTHYTDWQLCRLPDALFFLYYPLRPVLFFVKIFSGFYKRMGANS